MDRPTENTNGIPIKKPLSRVINNELQKTKLLSPMPSINEIPKKEPLSTLMTSDETPEKEPLSSMIGDEIPKKKPLSLMLSITSTSSHTSRGPTTPLAPAFSNVLFTLEPETEVDLIGFKRINSSYMRSDSNSSVSPNDQPDKSTSTPKETSSIYKKKRRWFVLISGCFLIFASNGFLFEQNVIFVDLAEEFGTSKAETALVMSVSFGVFFGSGLISGLIIFKYGVQKSGFIGGLIASIGLGVSYFANSIWVLVVTIGIGTGFGSSILYICSTQCIEEYFEGKARMLSLSLVSVFGGVTSMTYPYMLKHLTYEYSWRGGVLISGAIMLNSIPASLICITNKPKPTRVKLNRKISAVSDTIIKKFARIVKNSKFIFYTIGMAIAFSSYACSYIFLMDFLKLILGNEDDCLLVIFAMNIASTLFRFVPGIMKLIPHVGIFPVAALSTSLSAAIICYPWFNSFWALIIISCLFGMSRGGFLSTFPISVEKIVGTENFPNGIGVAMTVCCICSLSGGPILGLLFDVSGSYDLTFYFTASALMFSTLMFICIAIWQKWSEPKVKMPTMKKVRTSVLPMERSVSSVIDFRL